MAAHKGPAISRPRCKWGGSSIAAIPVCQSVATTIPHGKGKGTIVHVCAMKIYRENRGIALLI
jgi:hypothetical protein